MKFVKNYNDISTDTGYQFEFLCDRCGSGYRTAFQASATGTISGILDGASSVLGGIFNTASNVGDRVKSATWQKGWDNAFEKAQEEIKPHFRQCPKCLAWVCRENCWNEKKGLCKQCSPDLGVEMAAAQSNKSVEEVWAHAAMAEEDKNLGTETWRQGLKGTCPKCEAPIPDVGAKFCPECGAKLINELHCTQCDKKLDANAKFCPDCGTKVGN